jgi:hypothetical protein
MFQIDGSGLENIIIYSAVLLVCLTLFVLLILKLKSMIRMVPSEENKIAKVSKLLKYSISKGTTRDEPIEFNDELPVVVRKTGSYCPSSLSK